MILMLKDPVFFYVELKSDSQVSENFCQIKIFPSLVRNNAIICLFGA